jgi:hypothetical protein
MRCASARVTRPIIAPRIPLSARSSLCRRNVHHERRRRRGKLAAQEAVCVERWKQANDRLNRIKIMFGAKNSSHWGYREAADLMALDQAGDEA